MTVNCSSTKISSILIIQTAFLGDLLLGIPFLKQIRKLWPDCKIDLVCRKGLGVFLKEAQLIDQHYEIIKKNRSSYFKVKKQLEKTEYDFIFCPHQSMTSALLVYFLKAKVKIGFKKWWNLFFFDKTVVFPLDLPDPLRQMTILEPVWKEIREKKTEFRENQEIWNQEIWKKKLQKNFDFVELSSVPEWALPTWNWPWNFSDVSLKFQLPSDFFVIFPGSLWKTKQWTVEGFSQLIQELIRRGEKVVLLGGADEKSLCQLIAKNMDSYFVLNLAGLTTLQETIAILKGAKLTISNDSGGQHLAAVVACPTVSIFGPTVLEQGYRPWNSKAVVVQSDVDCRPCGKHGHQECPIKTHECMRNINVEQVFTAINKLKK